MTYVQTHQKEKQTQIDEVQKKSFSSLNRKKCYFGLAQSDCVMGSKRFCTKSCQSQNCLLSSLGASNSFVTISETEHNKKSNMDGYKVSQVKRWTKDLGLKINTFSSPKTKKERKRAIEHHLCLYCPQQTDTSPSEAPRLITDSSVFMQFKDQCLIRQTPAEDPGSDRIQDPAGPPNPPPLFTRQVEDDEREHPLEQKVITRNCFELDWTVPSGLDDLPLFIVTISFAAVRPRSCTGQSFLCLSPCNLCRLETLSSSSDLQAGGGEGLEGEKVKERRRKKFSP